MSFCLSRNAALALLLFAGVLLSGCKGKEPADGELYQAVDTLYAEALSGAHQFEIIAEIDHSRLAMEEGEVMPPARVIIFSDPAVNTAILELEPMTGLDLPFRVLAYAEGDTPRVIHTSAEFLVHRHGLSEGSALDRYRTSLDAALAGVPKEERVVFDVSNLAAGQGIRELDSRYGFSESIARLKEAILAEGDTIWFGEIDYQAEAAALGVELPALTLLLFGAPGPGAKAMAEFPRMGLDAFCQKVLVYQQPGGRVNAYFNEMPAFAELHHGSVALPHRVINRRMTATLAGAVEE
jgi:uncharacterized protein (DUF302 family)